MFPGSDWKNSKRLTKHCWQGAGEADAAALSQETTTGAAPVREGDINISCTLLRLSDLTPCITSEEWELTCNKIIPAAVFVTLKNKQTWKLLKCPWLGRATKPMLSSLAGLAWNCKRIKKLLAS